MERFDVIVVGAGPAGSTSARFAAEKGLSVLMLDGRKEIGWPVQCGELLGQLEEMRRIFPLVPSPEELFDIPKQYHSLDMEVISMYAPSMKRYDIPFGCYSTERRDYDKYLASLAVKEGATLMKEVRCTSLEDGTVHTTAGEFGGKVIIGADGPFSCVRKSLGIEGPSELYPAMSTTMPGDFGNEVIMYFGHVAPAGYAWIIPKNGGANVGLGADPNRTDGPVGKYAKG
ncbi:MAG: NAD(P)/FAD-dependent oxidoreductase, partial [Methanomassiliicoccales archaeon]